jgi:WW domain-binding protein 4
LSAKAAEAYAADLAAAGRLAEAAALKPKPLSAGARLREQEEHAKKELESAIERELHAREEAEYRATQALGAWKFDDRSKYYWHGKSSCYFDPKTKMYFNNVTKAWSKTAPEGAPPPPSTDSGGACYVESEWTVRPWTVCAWEGCFSVGINPSASTTYCDSQAGFRRRSKRSVDDHDLGKT